MTVDLFDLPGASSFRQRDPVILDTGAVLFPGMARRESGPLLDAARAVVRAAPFRHLMTPGGRRMSVAMTACGEWGWTSSLDGYRYSRTDPRTGAPWPSMPDLFRDLVRRATHEAGFAHVPLQSGLVNLYRPGTRMSLHQDREEQALDVPIVSVSFGVAATFLWGGMTRGDPVRRVRLEHGDVLVWGGPSRLRFHGVAPLAQAEHPETGACRVNLTFRRVTKLA
ncbi:DNA repair protein for alkylated DNA [Acetobacter estunensis NRIC 0472]|uniref:DNA oxidative demethylase AlkB n=1 Tax=Acetobacter estunensis TaxID=104097 RepID=A0A967B852_9PROT|nr:DNA oxidative demethylase AlkB [Acetobacter estunensis]NHO53821.1 DNA oxidative demethylase AlkB [Acetobacter estunensis]GBQ22534.1 DNA repair protein for alkylated DNA [Acetobacter estunensis NRIC 0472]